MAKSDRDHRDGDALTGSAYRSLESLDTPPPRTVQQVKAQQAQSGAEAQTTSPAAQGLDD